MRQKTLGARIWWKVYGLLMVLEFLGELIAGMRKYADLEQDELGERVGMTAAQIKRLEENKRKTPIEVELLRQIVRVTGVTKRIFAEILAKAASEYLGVRLEVLPKNALVTSNVVLKAIQQFSDHGGELDEDEQDSIDGRLDDLKCDLAQSERRTKSNARDIMRQINKGRRKRGEDPSDDSED